MSSGTVVTFYSYKGGVGRSFLLANTAVWLARAGFHVLAIDWDLEAPGLWHYFNSRGLLPSGPRRGLLDYLRALQQGEVMEFSELVTDLALPSAPGRLALVEAGETGPGRDGSRRTVIDFEALYEPNAEPVAPKRSSARSGSRSAHEPRTERRGLGALLEEARATWVREFDLVLLDSRTGRTDIGGICTAQLPDFVVAVVTPSLQGLDGTLEVIAKAREERARLPLDRGDFTVLPVVGRYDANATGEETAKWRRILAERLGIFYDEWRDKGVDPERLATLFRVPYVPRWSFGEPLPALDERDDDAATTTYAVATVGAFLASRLGGSAKLVEDRGSYLRKVVDDNRKLFGRGAEAISTFTYDLFLSFAGGQREFVRSLARELSDRKLRVFFDEASIDAGTRWVDVLAEGLKKARSLIVLVDGAPSTWQRLEVEAFRSGMTTSTEARFIVPVRMGDLSPWPEINPLHALEGRKRSPAEVASDLVAHLRRRENPEPEPEPRQRPLREPLWTPEEALAAYRAWLVKQHEKLVPYFRGASELILDQVYVELDLAPVAPGTADVGDPASDPDLVNGKNLAQRTRDAFHPPLSGSTSITLAGLLESRTAEGPAPRLVVMGDPGAGKTTLARSYARTSAECGSRTPIYVALARVGSGPLDPIAFAVKEMLGDNAEAAKGRVLRESLQREGERGSLVLLFDGLDEVDPPSIDRTLEEIFRYAGGVPEVAIAILGRPIVFEHRELPARIRKTRVLPLEKPRQDQLVTRLLGSSEASIVRTHLDQHRTLAEMASSPLLLTLIAVVARESVLADAPLPGSRAKLYTTTIDLFLRRGFSPEKKGVKDTGPARRILQRLSFELHDRGGESWTRAELSTILTALRRKDDEVNFLVKETWKSNDAFLDDLGHNAGILSPHDGPHLPWRYLHRSLREFLAAEDLLHNSEESVLAHVGAWVEATKARRRSKRESTAGKTAEGPDPARWGEVYALYAGLSPNAAPIIEALCSRSEELALRTLLSIDGLPPEQVIPFLLRISFIEDTHLLQWIEQAGVKKSRAAALLDEAITSERSIHHLSVLWEVLEALGTPPEREEFFRRANRWPKGGFPKIATQRIPPTGEPLDFLMGAPETEERVRNWESPQHRVLITPFALGRTAVTWRDYRTFDPKRQIPHGQTEEHPATEVSWWEARLYCRWMGGDLPTEAQWEAACRAGTATAYSFGGSPKSLSAYAWFRENSDGGTHPVGKLRPNPWGLFDMHGNVWEWCCDGFAPYPGSDDPTEQQDPFVPPRGRDRVLRGGSYRSDAGGCRSAARNRDEPGSRSGWFGFRVAFPAPPSS